MLVNPADLEEGTMTVIFNVNSDVIFPKFWSDPNGLTFLHDEFTGGYTSFEGNIGGGRIYIKTETGPIIIKGPIHGGPPEGQNFVGSGSWIEG